MDVFVGLLRSSDIHLVVDIRTIARSRHNPQYNSDLLPASLSTFGIGYEHVTALGGLRDKKPEVPPVTNALWQNQSFHNYADYAMGESFWSWLWRLRQLGHSERCVIMCAETLWWRCHRRIISDYLIATGRDGFSYYWIRSDQVGADVACSKAWAYWNDYLSSRCLNP